jgi:hypothetical protein
MAKQSGPIPVVGTIGSLTYYKMMGEFYVRRKTSLDRKRIKRDPAFARFRAHGLVFGQASRIASELYRMLPKEERQHGRFGLLTVEVKKLLQQEYTAEQILQMAKQSVTVARKKITLTPPPKTLTPSPVLSYADQVIAKALQTLLETPVLAAAGKCLTNLERRCG